ncbi:hypothetical protein BRARA_F00081 [Brassica rapa]|uniref:Uncharacterized protein n=1 Tax=Brassica campestris TaxID=3711 RepID=A0A397YTA7_BRACM|nr:hypothetical protein BRARA_F00081 [Brassica rapa]
MQIIEGELHMFSSSVIDASENTSIVGEEDETTVVLRSTTGESSSIAAELTKESTWQRFSSSSLAAVLTRDPPWLMVVFVAETTTSLEIVLFCTENT